MPLYSSILPIPNTVKVISECWKNAEEELQTGIKKYTPDKDEEFITETFHGKYKEALDAANVKDIIASSFLADLIRCYGYDYHEKWKGISQNLIADVTLHKKTTEGKTGGDLGIVIIRPNITIDNDKIKILDYKRGILAQAKIKRRDGKWGGFTPNQISLIPSILNFYFLLLYQYKDSERTELSNFNWQSCKDVTKATPEQVMSEIEGWFEHETFPKLLNSTQILQGVAAGTLGISNKSIIDTFICPTENQYLEIRITWPEGKSPGTTVDIHTRTEAREEVYVYQRY
jgi:hypothetical protein